MWAGARRSAAWTARRRSEEQHLDGGRPTRGRTPGADATWGLVAGTGGRPRRPGLAAVCRVRLPPPGPRGGAPPRATPLHRRCRSRPPRAVARRRPRTTWRPHGGAVRGRGQGGARRRGGEGGRGGVTLQASASGSATASTTAREGQTARRERARGGASRGGRWRRARTGEAAAE